MCSILYNVSGLMRFSFVVRDVDHLDVIMAILFELYVLSVHLQWLFHCISPVFIICFIDALSFIGVFWF